MSAITDLVEIVLGWGTTRRGYGVVEGEAASAGFESSRWGAKHAVEKPDGSIETWLTHEVNGVVDYQLLLDVRRPPKPTQKTDSNPATQ